VAAGVVVRAVAVAAQAVAHRRVPPVVAAGRVARRRVAVGAREVRARRRVGVVRPSAELAQDVD
jgi:hypothetical protein